MAELEELCAAIKKRLSGLDFFLGQTRFSRRKCAEPFPPQSHSGHVAAPSAIFRHRHDDLADPGVCMTRASDDREQRSATYTGFALTHRD